MSGIAVVRAIDVVFWLGIAVFAAACWILVFLPRPPRPVERRFRSLSVVVPAHNEAGRIARCLDSLLAARFDGDKEVIVVDDGSDDGTAAVVRRYAGRVRLVRQARIGKGEAINAGVAAAQGELVATVDADCSVHEDALEETAGLVERRGVAVGSAGIGVRNRTRLLCLWAHLEWLHLSLLRELWSKTDVCVATSGQLNVYRKDVLLAVGGFRSRFSEDVDMSLRLARAGWRASFTDRVLVETDMPTSPAAFARQRMRWIRGTIAVVCDYLGAGMEWRRDLLLPLFLVYYAEIALFVPLLLARIVWFWHVRFAAPGLALSWPALAFLVDTFTLSGVLRYAALLAAGRAPFSWLALPPLLGIFLSFGLMLHAVLRYEHRLGLRHLLPLAVFFPFWLAVHLIYLWCWPEFLRRRASPTSWLPEPAPELVVQDGV